MHRTPGQTLATNSPPHQWSDEQQHPARDIQTLLSAGEWSSWMHIITLVE